MKAISIVLLLMGFFSQAHAISEEKVCEKLQEQAYDMCKEQICEDDATEEYTYEDCMHNGDGDLHVAASECAWNEVQDLIEKYNKKNPKNKVTCED